MPNILDEIVAAKREELALVKEAMPLAAQQDRIAAQPPALSLADASGAATCG